MTKGSLTIGRLAQSCEVSVETVRYYQRLGLIEEPAKPSEGFRVYPDDTISRLAFIKRAQQLGFTLSEITELLEMEQGSCEDVRSRAEQKRAQVNAHIRDLTALRDTLDGLIDRCNTDTAAKGCPIIESLTQTDNMQES
ncbi:MAG: MerR family DNA-binding protein [Gammaproteobacteria bacterium]|nr:MerR family DNA-binding protein [Gammaproteobacteria bacterium]